jgi:site-specific recombinase XerD
MTSAPSTQAAPAEGAVPDAAAGAPAFGPSLAELVGDWLDTKQAGRGLRPASEEAYRRDLAAIAGRIAGAHDLDPQVDALGALTVAALTPDVVRGVLADLHREGYAPMSRRRMLGTLRAFCGWLVESGLLERDPTAGLVSPRRKERLPVAVTAGELERLVAAASAEDPDARPPWPLRDRAMIAVLAGAGPRASEVVALNVGDIVDDVDPPLVRISDGKGGKQRNVPIPSEVVEAVRTYLDDRAARFAPARPADPLFVTAGGARFTRQGLAHHVCRWFLRAAVARPAGEAVHVLRHTYATTLVAAGVPVTSVQQLLGHASIATTEIYLKATAAELAGAVQAAAIRQALRATG